MEGYKTKVYPQCIARFAIDNIESIIRKITTNEFAKKKDQLSREEIERLYENLEICRKTILDLIPHEPIG